MAVVEGIVNFSNITQHDVFNGQDTGQYSMTVTLEGRRFNVGRKWC